ncbi:hypothetical protein [Brevibacillus agri]|uniref:hypothetical protein n=1 Tax=Brevibacillus agri TaxID=51101 RepID=UPI0025B6ECCA|nr:hypothetical protein [Brevibacillus agri]MDN4096212.1 hypothetical protein [Brevibacillus agri]MED3498480.1 hypothetical protein [Brevibacillus agri]
MSVKGITTKIFGGNIAKKEEYVYWFGSNRKATIEVFDFSDGKGESYGIQATLTETGEKFAIETGFTTDKEAGLNEIVSLVESKLLQNDEEVKETLQLFDQHKGE